MRVLKSIELYLNYPSKKVLETDSIIDVGCGIYPCYYYKSNQKLYVSTSVVALIEHLGDFKKNTNFKPRDFYNNPPKGNDKSRFKNIFLNINKNSCLKRKALHGLHVVLKNMGTLLKFNIIDFLFKEEYVKEADWHFDYQTIDKRITKLKAFEEVTIKKNRSHLTYMPLIDSKEIIINKAAKLISNHVKDIEKAYPDYHHVVLTGGMDSQLIWLTPKLNKAKWSCFTSEPNVPVVSKWLTLNGIKPTYFFKHEDDNKDTLEVLKRKIICSDLFSDMSHLRWMPKMKEIASQFENKVIFWGGTAADAIFKYYPVFHKNNDTFYKLHAERVASFQGNYHQVFKNYTDCPYLSPYHSEEIWRELFLKMNPLFIKEHGDVRKILGEVIASRPVTWIDENPAPKAYRYNFAFEPIRYYEDYILEKL
jgi:asparagine synthetase B (glutamine-hydrolysing)